MPHRLVCFKGLWGALSCSTIVAQGWCVCSRTEKTVCGQGLRLLGQSSPAGLVVLIPRLLCWFLLSPTSSRRSVGSSPLSKSTPLLAVPALAVRSASVLMSPVFLLSSCSASASRGCPWTVPRRPAFLFVGFLATCLQWHSGVFSVGGQRRVLRQPRQSRASRRSSFSSLSVWLPQWVWPCCTTSSFRGVGSDHSGHGVSSTWWVGCVISLGPAGQPGDVIMEVGRPRRLMLGWACWPFCLPDIGPDRSQWAQGGGSIVGTPGQAAQLPRCVHVWPPKEAGCARRPESLHCCRSCAPRVSWRTFRFCVFHTLKAPQWHQGLLSFCTSFWNGDSSARGCHRTDADLLSASDKPTLTAGTPPRVNSSWDHLGHPAGKGAAFKVQPGRPCHRHVCWK